MKLSNNQFFATKEIIYLSRPLRRNKMHETYVTTLTIFVLACFVGYYVVWKVTPALHTPLMSVTNAISGIIVVGAIMALGASDAANPLPHWAGFFAVMLASVNIFGGFVVTQRMLSMFQKKSTHPQPKEPI